MDGLEKEEGFVPLSRFSGPFHDATIWGKQKKKEEEKIYIIMKTGLLLRFFQCYASLAAAEIDTVSPSSSSFVFVFVVFSLRNAEKNERKKITSMVIGVNERRTNLLLSSSSFPYTKQQPSSSLIHP